MKKLPKSYDRIVYLLQGGGALGSYQVGVCQGLLEFGMEPDWLVGTSIGSINAAIIAGNPPDERMPRLKQFWEKISNPFPTGALTSDNFLLQEFMNYNTAQSAMLFGQRGFFKPRLIYPWLLGKCTPDQISFYDTSELRDTLLEVIDFDRINKGKIRLTLGAVCVRTSAAVRFDSAYQTLGPEHVMASGALPPGFPAVKVGDEYYWDGGISSNTPFGVVLDEPSPSKLLCFVVNLFTHVDGLPGSMMDVMKALKEIEYSSRHEEVMRYFSELHYMQNVIQQTADNLVTNADIKAAVERIAMRGLPLSLNIARFRYLTRSTDLWSMDYNFAYAAVKEHWESGYADVKKAFEDPEWLEAEIDGMKGTVIHEF